MKICLLTYRGNPYCGGQGVYVSALGRELARMGHEVHCVTGPPYPPEVEGITWHRVPGLNLGGENGDSGSGAPWGRLSPLALYERAAARAGAFPEMAGFSLRAFGKVRALLSDHRFDVIHDNQSLGWGLLPLRALGPPLMATIHHPLTIDRGRAYEAPTTFGAQWSRTVFYPIAMQGMVARRMARVVTVSRASAEAITRDFGVPPERMDVVYNGVDAGLFRPRPKVTKVEGRVVFVGNIEDGNKGGIYLLRALAALPPPAHLLVVTGGVSTDGWFAEHVRRLGLRERVIVRQRVSGGNLVDAFASAQVAVSPSLFEGFGFPAAEAMACGLPLVAARGGALPEVVGSAGLLVPPRDPEALTAALARLLGDAPLRRRLGSAARRRVREQFQWRRAAREMTAVYERVIAEHRERGGRA